MRADRAVAAMAAGTVPSTARRTPTRAVAAPRPPHQTRPQWGLPTVDEHQGRGQADVAPDRSPAPKESRELQVESAAAEPKGRKAIRDLLALSFVIGAIVAGIYVGRDISDPGLGVGIGFAVCFVGAVVIGRTVADPSAKPPPRWAIVLSLVTSPLAIAIGLYEIANADAATGRYRLLAGAVGLVFGFEQRYQRRRQLGSAAPEAPSTPDGDDLSEAGRQSPVGVGSESVAGSGDSRRELTSELAVDSSTTSPPELRVALRLARDAGVDTDPTAVPNVDVAADDPGAPEGSSDQARRDLLAELLGLGEAESRPDDPESRGVEAEDDVGANAPPRPKVDGRAPPAPASADPAP